jgi:hypothetical protein
MFSKSSLHSVREYENKRPTENKAGSKPTSGRHSEQERIMLNEIRQVLHRSSETIWQDILGGTALMVVLVAGFMLPGLF